MIPTVLRFLGDTDRPPAWAEQTGKPAQQCTWIPTLLRFLDDTDRPPVWAEQPGKPAR